MLNIQFDPSHLAIIGMTYWLFVAIVVLASGEFGRWLKQALLRSFSSISAIGVLEKRIITK